MKLTIGKAHLLGVISRAQKVTDSKGTIPVLSHFLINATADNLTITGTDMDMMVSARTTSVDVVQPGIITAPAQTLADIVKRLPDGDVTLETDDGQLRIKCKRSKFAVATLHPDDFPVFAESQYPTVATMPASDLAGLFRATAYAMSDEQTRYYLNGVNLSVESDGGMFTAATDGHRLAVQRQEIPEGIDARFNIIVPTKAVLEILRLCDGLEEATVSINDTRIKVELGETTLCSKLIDSTFPDYNRVIPTHNDKRLTISRDELADTLGRVTAISAEKSRAIKIECVKGGVVITASDGPNDAREELDAEHDCDGFMIGFNGGYLLETLKHCHSESAVIEMSDAASPAIVRASEDDGWLGVVMPLRV